MTVFGVILAGGLARRMGGATETPGDKALIRLDDKTLLDHAVARVSPQVDAVVINANGDAERFGAALPVIPDPDDSRSGPLAGVLAGLDYAADAGASHIVTIAVDTPFFPENLCSRLFEAAQSDGMPLACAQTGERTHPVFGLWPVILADDLRAAMADGMRKVDCWTARHGCAAAVFGTVPFDPFFNINTPEDLAVAERMLA